MSIHYSAYPNVRMQRLRRSATLRRLVRETRLSVDNFIYPLFIRQDITSKQAIISMPGQYQLSLADLASEINEIVNLNIPAVILFGIPANKDATGSNAYQDNGIIQQAIRSIKQLAPDLLVISDVCCCEFTDHGHCGIFNDGFIDNDATLVLLQKQAVSHAQAGVDIIAPSGMMDGMVGAIREALDSINYAHIPILSYAAKYASGYYGPFREAAGGSAPQQGDRQSHQMDPANALEALREVELDIKEGADMLMVKPAGAYLDIIQRVKQTYPQLPLAAYQVSGEYAMIKAAAQQGWLDEQAIMLESLLAIKRAGADMIISYFAKDVAQCL